MSYSSEHRYADLGLGDFWDTINSITETVGKVAITARAAAPQIKDVVEGRSSIVTVPKGETRLVSGTGTMLGVSAPAWLLPVGLALGGWLLFRSRR